jgi:hypothetical protein
MFCGFHIEMIAAHDRSAARRLTGNHSHFTPFRLALESRRWIAACVSMKERTSCLSVHMAATRRLKT